MQVSRFWSSVGSVAALLFGVGLLELILNQVVLLFGLMPGSSPLGYGLGMVGTRPGTMASWLALAVAVIVPIWGTLIYLDWRWNWKPAHIGAALGRSTVVWTMAGMVGGLVAALLAAVVSGRLAGQGMNLAVGLQLPVLMPWLPVLLGAPGVELVYRGAVLARYQTDLEGWRVPVAAALTPFAWMVAGMFFGIGGPMTGINVAWTGAMSIALTLLVLRTQSLWLAVGVRVGTLLPIALGWLITPAGGLLVWGTIAAMLAVLEWLRLQKRPRRISPRGGSGRGRVIYTRNFRDPFGPH